MPALQACYVPGQGRHILQEKDEDFGNNTVQLPAMQCIRSKITNNIGNRLLNDYNIQRIKYS